MIEITIITEHCSNDTWKYHTSRWLTDICLFVGQCALLIWIGLLVYDWSLCDHVAYKTTLGFKKSFISLDFDGDVYALALCVPCWNGTHIYICIFWIVFLMICHKFNDLNTCTAFFESCCVSIFIKCIQNTYIYILWDGSDCYVQRGIIGNDF